MNKTEVTRITLASICSFPVYLIDVVTRPIESRLEQQRKYDYMKSRAKTLRKEYLKILRDVKKARQTEEEVRRELRETYQEVRRVENQLSRLQSQYEHNYRLFERWMPW